MIEAGSIKRRSFMNVVTQCGIALLAGKAVRAGVPKERSRRKGCSGVRRLMREYGPEFGGTAALRED